MNQGQILTLDDNNEYVVVKTKKYENEDYVYLIQEDDYTNIMFCKLTSESKLKEVVDPDLLEKLIIEFQN
jgi:hypothetical protein